jgi:hypothetical protein
VVQVVTGFVYARGHLVSKSCAIGGATKVIRPNVDTVTPSNGVAVILRCAFLRASKDECRVSPIL